MTKKRSESFGEMLSDSIALVTTFASIFGDPIYPAYDIHFGTFQRAFIIAGFDALFGGDGCHGTTSRWLAAIVTYCLFCFPGHLVAMAHE